MINYQKINDPMINDQKINDQMKNDQKINDPMINDQTINYQKINDAMQRPRRKIRSWVISFSPGPDFTLPLLQQVLQNPPILSTHPPPPRLELPPPPPEVAFLVSAGRLALNARWRPCLENESGGGGGRAAVKTCRRLGI